MGARSLLYAGGCAAAMLLIGIVPARASAAPVTHAGQPGKDSQRTGSTLPAAAVYHPVNAAAKAEEPLQANPAGCELFPSVVHLRKSGNFQTIGFKPYTICDYPVTSITQVSQMYKYHFFGILTEPVGPPFTAGNVGQRTLQQKNVAVNCTNTKSTKWFGVADGTMVEGGETYVAQVRTDNVTKDCGT